MAGEQLGPGNPDQEPSRALIPHQGERVEHVQKPRIVRLNRSFGFTATHSSSDVDEQGKVTGFTFSSRTKITSEVIIGDVDKLTTEFALRQGITDPQQIEAIRSRLTAEYERQEAEQRIEQEAEVKRVEDRWNKLLEKHPTLREDVTRIVDGLSEQEIFQFGWRHDPNPRTYINDLRRALHVSQDTRNIQVWKLPRRWEGRATRTRPFSDVPPQSQLNPGSSTDMIQ